MNTKDKILKGWNQYRRKKRWWSITFDFILLILIIAMLIPAARKNISTFVIRKTMLPPRETSKAIILSENDFDIILTDKDGNQNFLSKYIDKPLLINFWATWCPPCVAELPSLQKLYNKYKDDINFVFIVNEPLEVIENFLQKRKYNIPYYIMDGIVPDFFETAIIPTTYLIDNERIILHKTGAARWDLGKVTRIVDELIEKRKETINY